MEQHPVAHYDGHIRVSRDIMLHGPDRCSVSAMEALCALVGRLVDPFALKTGPRIV